MIVILDIQRYELQTIAEELIHCVEDERKQLIEFADEVLDEVLAQSPQEVVA